MGSDGVIQKAWESLSSTLQLGSGTAGSIAEQRYVNQIENLCLDLWVKVATQTSFSVQIKTYFDQQSFQLLTTITDYLKRVLRVPKYSEMYDDMEQFEKETEVLFKENPEVEIKLSKLKIVIEKVFTMSSNQNSDIKMSFAVFESFASLAQSPVREYRSLAVLKEVKSSFQPLFGEVTEV